MTLRQNVCARILRRFPFKSAPSFCDGTYIRYMRILVGFILFLFFFKSGFTLSPDIVLNTCKILAMQTIRQVEGIRLTTLIRHEALITK